MQHLVIIGNGITGVTTARNVRKHSDMKITIISGESKYFFPRTALMYVYMGHMKWGSIKPYEDWFWKKNKIDLIYAHVISINTYNKTLLLDNGQTIVYDKLVIATGSSTNKFGWPGWDLPGVRPNIELAKNTKIETGRGILVNEYLETNISGIYSAGDCAEIKSNAEGEKNRVEQLWYTGRMQGEVLAQNILGKKIKYDRGIWFNSAKFLDIEYQTYGFVSNVLPRKGEETFYWEHPGKKKCFRVVYSSNDRSVKGFNVLGIRLRHQVCERWIKENKPIEYVLENLAEANFDPEFYDKHEEEIINKFNRENFGKNVSLNKQTNHSKQLA